MKRYFDIILKHRFTTLTILIAITIFLGYGLKDLEFDSSFESIMPKKDADFLLNEEVKKIYGNNGKFIIINMPVESMQPDELQDFEKIHRDIEEYKNYNALKESSRLIKLNEQFSKKVVRYDELINNFSDDPEYQRTIARKIIKVFGKKYELNKNDYKKLEKELLRANKIKADEYVDLIVSPFTVKDLVGKDDTLTAFDLIEEDNNKKRIIPTTVEDISLFKKRLYNNPAFAGGIYVKNAAGDITDFGLMIRLKESFIYDPIIYEVEEIAKSYQNRNLVIQGLPVTYKFVNNYMESDLKIFLPLVTLVMIIVFFLNFKTTIGVLLPLSTLILSDIWILGLMGHLGFKLTVIGISLPPLMVAVGSSYSIHIMNQYYIDIKNIYSNNKIEGLKESINHITATVLLAGLTTFAGFFSLVTNQVSALREWGFFASLGVLFAVIISITLIPIILTFLPAHQNIPDTKLSAKPNIVDKLVPHIVHLVLNKTKLVIIITIVAVIISLIGTSMLVVETCIQAYFKKNDVVLTSADIIDIKYGGTYGLNILLNTGKKDGVKDPEFLKFIENFRLWLIAEENNDLHIGRTDSFTDFIKTMNLAMHDNNYTYYSIPDKQIDIESYIDMYTGDDINDDGLVDDFAPYVDKKFQTINLFARLRDKQGGQINSTKINFLINKINNYVSKNLPGNVTCQTSGEPKIIVRLSEYVVKGQYYSLLLSLIIVSLTVILVFKNFKTGIFGSIPIGCAVLFNFGVMGWTGIKLDLATAVISSITIGIGVDDTIHFLNTFKYFRKQSNSIDEALEKTMLLTGKAIIYTSVALIFGFVVLLTSSFMPIIYFGLLIALTMLFTTIGALVILPAVIKFSGVNLDESKSNSLFWRIFYIGRYFKY